MPYPDDQFFSFPIPRVNRFGYIFLDDLLVDHHYSAALYFEHTHSGDHLLHRDHLNMTQTALGPEYWRFPRKFLDYPAIFSVIEFEASQVCATIRTVSNPGLVWGGWKRKTRKALQNVDVKLRHERTCELRKARDLVSFSEAEYSSTLRSEARL